MVSRHLENSSHILEILNSTSEEFIAIKTSSAMFLKRQWCSHRGALPRDHRLCEKNK